jgi:uncharacterized protein YjiS (DUF1127 family)
MTITAASLTFALARLWHALAGSARAPWRQDRDLRELDDHLLSDIGVTRAEAERMRAVRPAAPARSPAPTASGAIGP